jgi:hypothetical protein
MSTLGKNFHGKSRVRLARVWRNEATGLHRMVEWTVELLLESAMDRAFTDGDNAGMTATDTCRNNVYLIAKQQTQPCSAEVQLLYTVVRCAGEHSSRVLEIAWHRHWGGFSDLFATLIGSCPRPRVLWHCMLSALAFTTI